MRPKYAILLDGGFVTKVLHKKLNKFPDANDVEAECQRISALPVLADHQLLRIYFYDAPPSTGTLKNPIDKSVVDLSKTSIYSQHESLLDTLELRPNFALRQGTTLSRGWKLGRNAMRDMTKNPRTPTAQDFVPEILQKGVDLRIGLDIALLSLRGLVSVIVIATGDSDLVPAFKFARREGVRMYLDHMGLNVRRELKAHSDLVL